MVGSIGPGGVQTAVGNTSHRRAAGGGRSRHMIKLSSGELRYQVAIRGWSHDKVAREAGVSIATISRAMRGMPVRGVTALRLVQALRRQAPIPELVDLVDAESA
jgi:hypothetical protein